MPTREQLPLWLEDTAMTRRGIGLFVIPALALLVALPTTEAQMPAKIPQIDILSPAFLPRPSSPRVSFSQGVHDHGDVEGQTVLLSYHSAAGQLDRRSRLAAALVQLRPEVIVIGSPLGARAAKQASITIPCVPSRRRARMPHEAGIGHAGRCR
jgi:ABC-type uncharacterized transport system substrate-binding protein